MANLTFLDGAFGTMVWSKTEGNLPVWTYNMTQPEVIKEVISEYIKAGAQIVQANTFEANRLAVSHASDYSVEDVVTTAVNLAKEAAAGADVKISLSAGPLTEMMEPYGDLEEDEVAEIYGEMFSAGVKAGANVIALETFIDLNMLRVVAEEAKKYGVPVFCTMSFEENGKTIFGNSVEDMIEELSAVGVDAVGLNCSLGPDKAVAIIKEFAEKTDLPLILKPNAGKPVMAEDGTITNPYGADDFVREMEEAIPVLSYVGGCCGTNPTYIAQLKAAYNN